ncbi:diaminopropionate ammonia-lyase [Segnochrobactraceae bacterium EtOH-i3]
MSVRDLMTAPSSLPSLFLAAPQADALRPLDGVFSRAEAARAGAEIRAWSGYTPTPLLAFPGLAAALGLGRVWCKYEAPRFGLGSFKALGGAYAVMRALQEKVAAATGETASAADLESGRFAGITRGITMVTASDGNHGLSVAWGAQRFGARAVVYLHRAVSPGREALIREVGGDTVRIAGNYDDSVADAARVAREKGWILVADTSDDLADPAPARVMAGYGVLVREALDAIPAAEAPTHVVLQGGCGGMAAAVAGLIADHCDDLGAPRPRFIIVEPENAACLIATAAAGAPVRIAGDLETIMAGLSVGEVSALAWPVLHRLGALYMTIPDGVARDAMEAFGRGSYGDAPVVIGDAGVAGLAGLIHLARSAEGRALAGLDGASRVLTIATEGAVDREGYRRLTGLSPDGIAAAPADA